ncbi:MAG: hypothetical protein FIO02_07945 [Nitrosopumilales archaeon]|nr:hypothetical protein [Nitrosopumilales archaeon]
MEQDCDSIVIQHLKVMILACELCGLKYHKNNNGPYCDWSLLGTHSFKRFDANDQETYLWLKQMNKGIKSNV